MAGRVGGDLENLYMVLRNIETRVSPRDWDTRCEWSAFIVNKHQYPREHYTKITAAMNELLKDLQEKEVKGESIDFVLKRSAERVLEIIKKH